MTPMWFRHYLAIRRKEEAKEGRARGSPQTGRSPEFDPYLDIDWWEIPAEAKVKEARGKMYR